MSDKLSPALEQKARRLKTTYKQTLADHDALRAEQGNKCAICKRGLTKSFSDFREGKVQGLLCFMCFKTIKWLSWMKSHSIPIYTAIDYFSRGQ